LIRILPSFSKIYGFIPLKATRLVALICLFSILIISSIQSQNLSGQWIGGFGSVDEAAGRKTGYVLEMEFTGNKISGYSYTYFAISGKQYFVICKLSGTYDKGSKSMIVNEIEKIKSNTPPDFENCLQSHQLTYLKQKDKEILAGKWKPYIKESNCGSGITELERKKLERITPTKEQNTGQTETSKTLKQTPKNSNGTNPVKPVDKSSTALAQKTTPQKNETVTKATVSAPKKDNPSNKTTTPVLKPIQPTQKNPSESPKTTYTPPPTQQPVVVQAEKKPPVKTVQETQENRIKPIINKPREKYNKRNYEVIRTIEVSGPSIQIDIYDNGQVDGDTVSIFLNEKLLVPKKMLTAHPISLNIKLDDEDATYDLIMFAESLGSIPPNTAFMLITTSTARYEINISSTEQTSGAIRFKLKK